MSICSTAPLTSTIFLTSFPELCGGPWLCRSHGNCSAHPFLNLTTILISMGYTLYQSTFTSQQNKQSKWFDKKAASLLHGGFNRIHQVAAMCIAI